MLRKLIHIDEEACNGCGLCAETCHEGAIAMIEGRARLVREDYCDGLGDCLPACPTGAISFAVREAPAYDEEAANKAKALQKAEKARIFPGSMGASCPGTVSHFFQRGERAASAGVTASAPAPAFDDKSSCLSQWPVQLKLAPVRAPYFQKAHLLIAADCTAYAYGNFHQTFMKGKVTLIGCPKLDEGDYRNKLTLILAANEIQSLTVVRMEVPCCGGIVHAAQEALQVSGKDLPFHGIILSLDGRVLQG